MKWREEDKDEREEERDFWNGGREEVERKEKGESMRNS